ncbi:unnamed protein product [Porites evermanni]|uniref:Uncharacterized protein n=1 Tax=Porites evermanni TaxID=104178 RepID=A0ABN8T2Y3_9CNID|nr:unnamed protein product [Porites evermanni]
MEIEQGTFTPLVFTTTGGMADECVKYHNRLVELISNKKGDNKGVSTTTRLSCLTHPPPTRPKMTTKVTEVPKFPNDTTATGKPIKTWRRRRPMACNISDEVDVDPALTVLGGSHARKTEVVIFGTDASFKVYVENYGLTWNIPANWDLQEGNRNKV